jgi:hypothetical protein
MLNVSKNLWDVQGARRRSNANAALRLYTGSMAHTLDGIADAAAVLGLVDQSCAYNLIQAVVDTKFNHLIRNQVRPLFITEGGDSDLQDRVQAMQLAADGIADALGLNDDLEEQAILNGLLFEAGGVDFYADTANARVVGTPLFAHDFFVSRQESRFGAPQQAWCRQVVPRDALAGMLSGASKAVRDAIESAKAATWEDIGGDAAQAGSQIVDMVVIYKGWHLPTTRVDLKDRAAAYGRNDDTGRAVQASHDGRHMVVIEGAGNDAPPLIDVAWPYTYYPQSWFKPNRVPGSFWSRGEPEILAATQVELNKNDLREGMIVDLHARPMIFLSKGAKLNPAMINNALANIYQVEGNSSGAITVVNVPAVSPDLLNRSTRLREQARDQRGMSEMSMTARKPTGVNHEPGLAYLADTETVRHTGEFRARERFKVSCYVNIIRCVRDLAAHDENYEVIFENDGQLKRQKWVSMDVDEMKYRVRKPPTNALSRNPPERAQQIMELVERGFLPPSAAVDAFREMFDIKSLIGDQNVMQQNAEKRISDVVKASEYSDELMPDPYMDLQMLKRLGIQRKNKLELMGDKPEKIERLVEFLQDVDAQIAKLAPPAPPVAPGPGAPGGPGAPPQLPPGVTQAPPPIV